MGLLGGSVAAGDGSGEVQVRFEREKTVEKRLKNRGKTGVAPEKRGEETPEKRASPRGSGPRVRPSNSTRVFGAGWCRDGVYSRALRAGAYAGVRAPPRCAGDPPEKLCISVLVHYYKNTLRLKGYKKLWERAFPVFPGHHTT